MKIDRVWLVYDPTSVSVLGDVVYETDVVGMCHVFMGSELSDRGSWERERYTVYTDEAEAREDATRRMAERDARGE